jgi:hypothetical protein
MHSFKEGLDTLELLRRFGEELFFEIDRFLGIILGILPRDHILVNEIHDAVSQGFEVVSLSFLSSF